MPSARANRTNAANGEMKEGSENSKAAHVVVYGEAELDAVTRASQQVCSAAQQHSICSSGGAKSKALQTKASGCKQWPSSKRNSAT